MKQFLPDGVVTLRNHKIDSLRLRTSVFCAIPFLKIIPGFKHNIPRPVADYKMIIDGVNDRTGLKRSLFRSLFGVKTFGTVIFSTGVMHTSDEMLSP